MNFNLDLNDKYFTAIKNGDKKVEGRAPSDEGDNRYDEMTMGDTITFTNNTTGEQLFCGIMGVSKYQDVKTMLETEKIQNCLPGIQNIEEGVKIYHSLTNYEERIKKFGIYAVGVKTLISK